MNIDVIIPTKKRNEKLCNCINSLIEAKKHYSVNVYVYFDNNEDLNECSVLFSVYDWLHFRIENNYRVPTFWNTHLKQCKADVLCYLNDDVIVKEDIFKQIVKAFIIHFPDFDGVVGINQVNIPEGQKVESAFGVIGIKYANRFPNKQVFCPDYYRFFADFELWQYAKHINKFVFSKKAQLIHLHPAFDSKQSDETHKEVRKYFSKDKKTFNIRKDNKLLWGLTYQLITKE